VVTLGFIAVACRSDPKVHPSNRSAVSGRPSAGATPKIDRRATAALKVALRVGGRIALLPASDAPGEAPLVLFPAMSKGSWRVLRPVAVFRRPSTRAPIRGSVAKFTRLPRVKKVDGPGCVAGFLVLAANAYVCGTNLRRDRRPSHAARQPGLGANRLTPGTYGYIRTGGAKLYWTLPDGVADRKGKPIAQSDTVRWAGKRFFKGMKFWRITSGFFIRGNRVRRFWPSGARGVDLTKNRAAPSKPGVRLPLVFMVSRRRRRIGEKIPPVDVHASPGGKVVTTLKRYTAHTVVDGVRSGEFRWYRVPGKGWVSSEMVRLAKVSDPPPGLHPAQRWIDVDLEEQTLVAYRGRAPVYAALVAAGVWKYPTPVGTFRIYKKMAEADMKSEAKASEQYRVDHVPWTLYFKRGYALHGAYWHDGFGHARSHGCINLSPVDARFLYHFVRPVLPNGWTSLVADKDHPGTVVRIRGPKKKKNLKTDVSAKKRRRPVPLPVTK
jgi:L,D-transpeptidase catalytic domain